MICFIAIEVPLLASILAGGGVLWLFKISRWREFAADFETGHGRRPSRSEASDLEAFEEWRMTYHKGRPFRPGLHLARWISAGVASLMALLVVFAISEQCAGSATS